MRFYYSADCALLTAGTIRGDQIYPPGVLKLHDTINCFPFEDPAVVIRLTGASIVAAIENGLSKLPAFEGRFTHVSNISYVYDVSLPPGGRLISCKIGGEPVQPDKKYTVATGDFMAKGGDGNISLTKEGGGAEYVVDKENGALISMVLHQYFLSLKVIGKWSRGKSFREFFGGLKSSMVDKGQLIGSEGAEKRAQGDDDDDDDVSSGSDSDDEEILNSAIHESDLPKEQKVLELVKKVGLNWARLAGVREGGPEPSVDWAPSIAPKVEGRIVEK